tara:strand:+ start:51 stop:338 length:288 start_codon:yes stop_codon:yes gene_type:complete
VGQGNKKRKPGRYANGALISSAKADMQTEQQKGIRRKADNLRNALLRKGKRPKGTEAGHNIDGKGTNGWESIAKNRAVETKNKKKNKLKIVHHHV